MIKKMLALIVVLGGIFFYLFFLSSNVNQEYALKLNESSTLEAVLDSFERHDVIKNQYIFDLIQQVYSIRTIPSGYYIIRKSMTSLDILRKLKYGRQDPIKFTISTATFIEDIAQRVGKKMRFDSATFMQCLLADSNLEKYHCDSAAILTKFLPNTHEFYWSVSPQQFIDKWIKSSDEFWNPDRLSKAELLDIQPKEVYILASMVQKEYTQKEERSKIAQVLLNRLRLHMPLQVDATCKYATRDFAAKRVTSFHTRFPSPYNTYLNMGIPPSPICVPEIETIDAVLNPDAHDYIFYCADPRLNGYHLFSKTLADHEAVAVQYHKKMNEKGIR